MATVADLKQKARSLEQEGDGSKALAIYKHILAHLEGTPAIKQELPLYVKVGDLLLKQGNNEAAVSMYERAGRHYAEHGSAKSILALCNKVLRVDPKRTSVYFKFSSMMLDREHVLPAREVLLDYVGRMKLEKAKVVLERLADRPADEVRPVLEKLLEVGQRSKTSPESPPQAAAPEAVVEEPQPEPPAPVEPPAPTEPPVVEQEPEEPLPEQPVAAEPVALAPEPEPGPPALVEEPEAPQLMEESEPADAVDEPFEPTPSLDGLPMLEVEAPELDAEPPRSPAPPPEVEPEYWETAEPVAEEVVEPVESWSRPEPEAEPVGAVVEDPERSGRSSHQPEMARSGPLIRDQEPKKKSMLVWIGAAAGVVVIGTGAAFLTFGGGGNGGTESDQAPEQPTPPPVVAVGDSLQIAADTTADTTLVLADSASLLADSTPLALADTTAVDTAGPADSLSGALDSVVVPPPAGSLAVAQDTSGLTGAVDSVADTAQATIPAPVVMPPIDLPAAAPPQPSDVVTRLPAGVTVSGPIIVVDGLEIESVTELASGYRVVQLLQSGERLVLTINPLGADSTAPAVGAVRITTLGTTAVGVVRFGEFVVNARGVVAGDVLETLLEGLVEISSS